MSVFFTSDLHWNHKSVVSGPSKHYSGSSRDFKDLEEMNASLINGINSFVGENDVLYNLGDATFNGIESIWNLRKQLKVKTIHYVYGNHCHHYKRDRVLPNCHYELPGFETIKDGPADDEFNKRQVRVNDLFTSMQDVVFTEIEKVKFFMSHYPHLSWDRSNRGVIMLHGHEHGDINYLNEDCKRLDVGVDSAKKILGEYRPFSFAEILEITKNKPDLKLGHHL